MIPNYIPPSSERLPPSSERLPVLVGRDPHDDITFKKKRPHSSKQDVSTKFLPSELRDPQYKERGKE